MKQKTLTASAGAAMLSGLFSLAPTGAVAFEIDFGEFSEGTIIDDEYSSAQYGGLTVRAINGKTDDGIDFATVYDPSTGGQGEDPDLEDSFIAGKAWRRNGSTWNEDTSFSGEEKQEVLNPGTKGRKILIVQEDRSGVSCDGTTCDPADDEAGGPNFLIFDFLQAATIEHLDIFDIDNNESAKIAFFNEANVTLPSESDYNQFMDTTTNVGSAMTAFYDVSSAEVGGDGGAGRFFFGAGGSGVENVRSMVVAFSSSGAVSGLRGTTAVSEPGTIALFGGALAGLLAVRRRSRRV